MWDVFPCTQPVMCRGALHLFSANRRVCARAFPSPQACFQTGAGKRSLSKGFEWLQTGESQQQDGAVDLEEG